MRRADRLFQIVQLLRVKRMTTAADMARELEISTRTVYRDIQDLLESGVPIEGEAGGGHREGKGLGRAPAPLTVGGPTPPRLRGGVVRGGGGARPGVARPGPGQEGRAL